MGTDAGLCITRGNTSKRRGSTQAIWKGPQWATALSEVCTRNALSRAVVGDVGHEFIRVSKLGARFCVVHDTVGYASSKRSIFEIALSNAFRST